MSGETRFVLLLLGGIAALIGGMVALQARHRGRLRRADPLVLRVPAPPSLRQVAVVTAWLLGTAAFGIAGLLAVLRAGAPLAPTLALGIVAVAAVAIALALRAERRSSVGTLTVEQQSLRISLPVEGSTREIVVHLQQPFVVERYFCPRAPGGEAIVCRVDQGERSLWLWHPPGLLGLREIAGEPLAVLDELRGLYLGGDGAEVVRRLRAHHRLPARLGERRRRDLAAGVAVDAARVDVELAGGVLREAIGDSRHHGVAAGRGEPTISPSHRASRAS